jgi:periplasmic protein TonB
MNAQSHVAGSSSLDESWLRLIWAIPFALILWTALLISFGLLLERTAPPPPEMAPAQLRIVELPPAGLQGGSASPKPASPPKVKVEAPKPHVRVHVPHIMPHVRVHPLHHKIVAPVLAPSPFGTAKEAPESAKSAPAVASPTGGSGGTGVSGGSGAGTGAGLGSDSGGARAIYAPKPIIPDSLREEAFQAVAVAHFKVSYSGDVLVSLTTPTQNPQLNAILLDTLKQWRFFPARRNGVTVDSQFDVRIPITVQ